MTGIIIAAAVLVLLALLLFAAVDAKFQLECDKEANQVSLTVQWLFVKFNLLPIAERGAKEEEKREEEAEKKEDSTFQELREKINFFFACFEAVKEDIRVIFHYTFAHALQVPTAELDLKFGFSDPMVTGIMTGVLNGAAYNIMAILDRNMSVKHWDIAIAPDFDREQFSLRFYCILRTRMVHAIVIGIRFIKIWIHIRKKLKEEKGGK
jgi:predicted secreted protein